MKGKIIADIIRGLTKYEENANIHSENVLTWAKREEAQRAQTAVINRLHEAKNFDTIVQTDIFSTRKRCKYCRYKHKSRQCPAYGKRCDKLGKLNHFKLSAEVPGAVNST